MEHERFQPGFEGEIWYEHWHRYHFALALAEGRRVIDIACGEGYGSSLLATRAKSVLGVDVAADTLAQARRRYGAAANLEYREGRCEAIPCEDASADLLAGSPWRIDLMGDLNGDGKADLIWRNISDGSTYATLMNGTTTLSANYLMGAASGWTATHLLDLNGDGKRDILWRYVDGTLATWIMNGLAPIDAAGLIGPSTYQVVPPSP